MSKSATLTASFPSNAPAGQAFSFIVNATNTGTEAWTLNHPQPFSLGCCDPSGGNDDQGYWGAHRFPLPSVIHPGQSCQILAQLTAPISPGSYPINLKMLQEGVAWFPSVLTGQIGVVEAGPPMPISLASLLQGVGGWREHNDCVGLRLFNTLGFLGGSPPPIYSKGLVNDTPYTIQFRKLRVWIGMDIGTKGDCAGLIDRVSADGSKIDTFYDQSLDHYADGWGHTDQILSFAHGERLLCPGESLILRYWYATGNAGAHGHVGVNADVCQFVA